MSNKSLWNSEITFHRLLYWFDVLISRIAENSYLIISYLISKALDNNEEYSQICMIHK